MSNMSPTLDEIIRAVNNINILLHTAIESNPKDYSRYLGNPPQKAFATITSDFDYIKVCYLGYTIWNSEEDPRYDFADGKDLMDLEKFLAQEVIDRIQFLSRTTQMLQQHYSPQLNLV